MSRRLGPCITFFPQPTTLVASVDSQGKSNLMTASWAGIVSKTPPTLAVSLHQGRLTYRNIRESGCFTVNLVPGHLAVEADFCGITSGRQRDKWQATGLSALAADRVAAPRVGESPLSVECRLAGEVELGEYRLLLGEILEVHATESALAGEGKMNALAFDPLVYLGGLREYWTLGQKAGDAYQAGKKLSREPLS